MLEVSGDDFVYKSLEVMNLEGLPIVDPRNNVGVDLVLVNGLEHLVELPRKGQLGRRQVWVLGEAREGECANVHSRFALIAAASNVIGAFVSWLGRQYDFDGIAKIGIICGSIPVGKCIISLHLCLIISLEIRCDAGG